MNTRQDLVANIYWNEVQMVNLFIYALGFTFAICSLSDAVKRVFLFRWNLKNPSITCSKNSKKAVQHATWKLNFIFVCHSNAFLSWIIAFCIFTFTYEEQGSQHNTVAKVHNQLLFHILKQKQWIVLQHVQWLMVRVRVRVMVFNTTFNVSVISWRSVLLVEETRVCRENHCPATSNWQTLSHDFVSSTSHLNGIQTHNFSGGWL